MRNGLRGTADMSARSAPTPQRSPHPPRALRGGAAGLARTAASSDDCLSTPAKGGVVSRHHRTASRATATRPGRTFAARAGDETTGCAYHLNERTGEEAYSPERKRDEKNVCKREIEDGELRAAVQRHGE